MKNINNKLSHGFGMIGVLITLLALGLILMIVLKVNNVSTNQATRTQNTQAMINDIQKAEDVGSNLEAKSNDEKNQIDAMTGGTSVDKKPDDPK